MTTKFKSHSHQKLKQSGAIPKTLRRNFYKKNMKYSGKYKVRRIYLRRLQQYLDTRNRMSRWVHWQKLGPWFAEASSAPWTMLIPSQSTATLQSSVWLESWLLAIVSLSINNSLQHYTQTKRTSLKLYGQFSLN